MQAIRTRYIGPTNSHGSRIQAKCEARTMYMPYEHGLGLDENHNAARQMLIDKMGWNEPTYPTMVTGWFEGDYFHVFKDRP